MHALAPFPTKHKPKNNQTKPNQQALNLGVCLKALLQPLHGWAHSRAVFESDGSSKVGGEARFLFFPFRVLCRVCVLFRR